MLPIFLLYIALVSAIPFQNNNSGVLRRRELTRTSRYTRLTKRINPAYTRSNTPVSYNTLTRPSDQEIQQLIEVSFNNVPRSLLLDTGSSDAWMVTPDVQCLDADLSPVPRSECKLGDAYDGPEILQIGNETYSQIYGTKEVVSGPIGYADVTVAGLTVEKQKVALVNEGYILGDGIRSGVLGLAPRAMTRLFESTSPSNSAPNGTATTYRTVFEGMTDSHKDSIAPSFSLALQRGEANGYIAFGGLPPINFTEEFAFAPFEGLSYNGSNNPTAYYPIQPQGFALNGVNESTKYRAIIDSGTYANRLPTVFADRVNAAFDPPATYNATYTVYFTSCNATVPSFSFKIGQQSFAMSREDMLLPSGVDGICATSFTRGFDVPASVFPDGLYVLGHAFLHNVVAVFDVGGGGMHFAKHDY